MSLVAEYHGTCEECEDPIIPGQRIQSVDDEWQHVDCNARPARVECVCEKCFLVHAPQQAVCW